MNTTRYWILAAGFCALLATTYVSSQKLMAHRAPSIVPTESSAVDAAAKALPQDYCFNEAMLAVSCEYETMLSASGNAADVKHVVLAP